VNDLGSVEDLAAIVYDSGVQLGAGCLKDEGGFVAASDQQRELASLARLERRIREEASRLVDELLLGWKELGTAAAVRRHSAGRLPAR
jgi:hypothetical protein